MSFVAVAIGAVAIGTAAYSADQQRKNMHQQQDALKASQEADTNARLQAQTDASLAANSQVAATNRRRRDNALALGDPGGTSSVLGGGSALGAGSATTVAATPRTPTTVLGSAAR
jgi:lysylphosphatidylglycerol synthetase-like protein (DUF2156 family)